MPPDNFLHEENLDYLLEAVQAEMFGAPLYPTISDKAALYCYNIICNHIFTDGNKRTGLAAALIFLNLNGFDLRLEVTNSVLTDYILKVAAGQSDLQGAGGADCRTAAGSVVAPCVALSRCHGDHGGAVSSGLQSGGWHCLHWRYPLGGGLGRKIPAAPGQTPQTLSKTANTREPAENALERAKTG